MRWKEFQGRAGLLAPVRTTIADATRLGDRVRSEHIREGEMRSRGRRHDINIRNGTYY